MHSSRSSTRGLDTWRDFRLPGTRYMSLLPGICCYHLLVLFAWSCLTLFDSKLCLGGVVGSRELWKRVHLLQRLLYTFPSMFCLSSVSPLECYISAWRWHMVSLSIRQTVTLGLVLLVASLDSPWAVGPAGKGREVERGVRRSYLNTDAWN